MSNLLCAHVHVSLDWPGVVSTPYLSLADVIPLQIDIPWWHDHYAFTHSLSYGVSTCAPTSVCPPVCPRSACFVWALLLVQLHFHSFSFVGFLYKPNRLLSLCFCWFYFQNQSGSCPAVIRHLLLCISMDFLLRSGSLCAILSAVLSSIVFTLLSWCCICHFVLCFMDSSWGTGLCLPLLLMSLYWLYCLCGPWFPVWPCCLVLQVCASRTHVLNVCVFASPTNSSKFSIILIILDSCTSLQTETARLNPCTFT